MPKSKRLRGPRYRPADFRWGALKTQFDHRHAGSTSGQVVDFSGQGIALSVDRAGGTYLVGDTLSVLRVTNGEEVFYEGSAVVRHVREENGSTILGIAFRDAWMDMARLYRLDLRLDLEHRFGAFFSELHEHGRIDPHFKAWVADMRYFLDELHARLEAEEKRIRDLDLLTRAAVASETVDLVVRSVNGLMRERIAGMNDLVEDLDEDRHQLYRAYFQHHLNSRFLESPFMSRSFLKPLGYAGDYEVMNMLYRDHREGSSLFGRVLNAFACSLTAATANINRIDFLCERAASLLSGRTSGRLASVGCGPAREVRMLIERHPDLEGCEITLLDIEPLAIQFCEKVVIDTLRGADAHFSVRFIRESVRDLIRQERLDEVLDHQDVILASGLFDYFSDRMFQRLLMRLFDLLRPGGHLFIGNVDISNDSRWFMEYMAEWFLHHRSREQLVELAKVLPPEAEISVEEEPLGVNLFLHVKRRENR